MNHDVDCQAGAEGTVHDYRAGYPNLPLWDAGNRSHAHGYFSGHQHPGGHIIWTYNSLEPQDLADRIVTITERNLTTTVDNIEHIESQSLYGIAVVKVFFQPTVSIDKGHRADHRKFPNAAQAAARRHHAAFDH